MGNYKLQKRMRPGYEVLWMIMNDSNNKYEENANRCPTDL